MAGRVTRRNKAVLSGGLHPHYRAVCETYARFAGNELAIQDAAPGGGEDLAALIDGDTSCVVVQNPDFYGEVRDYSALAEICHEAGALLVVVVTEIVSLGRDSAARRDGRRHRRRRRPVARQRAQFRRPLCRAVRDAAKNSCGRCRGGSSARPSMPRARRGWVLTLSTREQHIRREKATSNICTNSGSVRAGLHDPSGVARRSRADPAGAAQSCDSGRARRAARADARRAPRQPRLFQRIRAASAAPGGGGRRGAGGKGILAGVPVSRFYPGRDDLADLLLVAATETVTEDDIDRLEAGLGRCCDERLEPGLERPPLAATMAAGSRRSAATAGLQIEEPLIFEQDAPGRCGVDLPEPPPFAAASAVSNGRGRSACRVSASRR